MTPYTFHGTKVSIPKHTNVLIPVWAIHRDPEIYPHPEEFDPERFNDENEKHRHSMNYLPFGDGPHNCIGNKISITLIFVQPSSKHIFLYSLKVPDLPHIKLKLESLR